jgi:hypothetical protein
MVTDWFKVNYHVINWTTPRQVDIVAITRGPTIDEGSQARFAGVTSLASLANYPEYVPVRAGTDATVIDVGYTFYLRDGTPIAPITGETLQLVYDLEEHTPTAASFNPANIEEPAGWTFTPPGGETVVQESMVGAVYHLVGTYSGVVNPVLFYTTQGIGDFTIIHDDSRYGQTNTSAANDDEHVLLIDTAVEATTPLTISTVARTSNVATIVTTANHGLSVGSVVQVTTATHAAWDGVVVVTAVPTGTSFTYANTGANQAAVADAGTVAYKASTYSAVYTLLYPGTPPWEGAHAHHMWLEPQRTNLIANPSFEHPTPGMYWRYNTGALTRVTGGVDPYRPYCGMLTGGSVDKVIESNWFPVVGPWMSVVFHIAVQPSALSATMKWGLVGVDPTYAGTTFVSSDEFLLGGEIGNGVSVTFQGVVGNYASASDISALGDMSVLTLSSATDWTPSGNRAWMSHFLGTGNNRSWGFRLVGTTGRLRIVLSTDGINATAYDSTASPTITDGAQLWTLVTRNATTGDIKFYTSPYTGSRTPPVIGSFTQLGTTVAGPTGTLFNAAAEVEVGSDSGGTALNWDGAIYRAAAYSGIYGSGSEALVRNFDPHDATNAAMTSWVATPTGETWTLHGTYATLNFLSEAAFVEFRGLIPVPVNMAEMCFRVEVDGATTVWLDNNMVDPHEGQYEYFDGASQNGLPNDFRWMGGEGDAHFSLWYSNYQNTRYRLMGDYDTLDDVYKPGLVEEWAPTGANIIAHWDAVTTFTPTNWQGDAYYPLAQITGTQPNVIDEELDFLLVPKP